MGKALYRKYRSKSLDEIVGQEHITDTLKNALKKNAISHAYLFTGPRGTGKTSIARILAHEINNIPYQEEATHLDIVEIDAASNRRIDEIRELRDKVHIAPTTAKYRVYIIDEVHMLTREAFNALLKTLEEPPEHAVFMLATTEAHKIPDTIMSRTQRYTLKPVEIDKVKNHLASIANEEKINISGEALQLLAQHGGGSFRDSISMLDQLSGLSKDSYDIEDVQILLGVPTNDVIESILDDIAQNDQIALFEHISLLAEHGIDVNRAALALSKSLRAQLLSQEKKVLPQEKILKLLSNLLTVTASSHEYIALELALLDVIVPQEEKSQPANPVNEVKLETKKSAKPMSVKAESKEVKLEKEELLSAIVDEEEKVTKNNPTSQATKTKNSAVFNQESWKELLQELKSTHNTLYGLLRMAKPSIDQDTLLLEFSFGFHKKQLETNKNAKIVQEYVERYFSINSFSAVVKKAANKPEDKPAEKHVDNKSELALDTVSDIFGSAELLES